jgi:hypothetical protein
MYEEYLKAMKLLKLGYAISESEFKQLSYGAQCELLSTVEAQAWKHLARTKPLFSFNHRTNYGFNVCPKIA